MIQKIQVESFKSLEKVEVELGLVNVFIGANGSGKSNLLEAIGVLSAAANGKLDDPSLLQRGVRPGVPRLYKSAFQTTVRQPAHIFFGAESRNSSYEVTLHNPLANPLPAWEYKTESLRRGTIQISGRSPRMKEKPHPEQGLAALQSVTLDPEDVARRLLTLLQKYVIYSPTTSVLRGIVPETQPVDPIGLSGGRLPDALHELLNSRRGNSFASRVTNDALQLIDWASSYGSSPSHLIPLSPSASTSARVVRFTDRHMMESRNVLSGYDASEGALYVLFLIILAAHPRVPAFCAVDNADHGLNPRLARELMLHVCRWYIDCPTPRQLLLTTHNPLVLDGLLLQDDRIRLFTVSRSATGRTMVERVKIDPALIAKAKDGWSLSRLWVMGHLGGIGDV